MNAVSHNPGLFLIVQKIERLEKIINTQFVKADINKQSVLASAFSGWLL